MIDIDRTLRLLDVAAESDFVQAEAIDAINYLREENKRLREALEPFADVPTHGEFGGPMVQARVYYECEPNDRCGVVTISPNKFRAAAAAIREGGK